ncbi:hypothetical protein ACQ859_20740 [Roseateles chitinivorans]|uniref:hypothetical protein n=1 Tax=Roseateles chitinivorans TaxID=2917965 RepID=UPI003D6777DC
MRTLQWVLAIGLTVSGVASFAADPMGAPARAGKALTAVDRCMKQHRVSTCRVFYVRTDDVLVHSEPREESEVVARLPGARGVLIDWKSTREAPKGWVSYERDDHGGHGWIQAKDVAGVLDFRRVVGCWPVRHFWDEVGDSRFEIYTTVDGLGRSSTPDGPRTEVWFTDSLILFDSRLRAGADVFHYDTETGKLRNGYGFKDSGIEHVDDADPEACKGGLKLR